MVISKDRPWISHQVVALRVMPLDKGSRVPSDRVVAVNAFPP